jgi:hypothetical protein
MFLNIFNFQYFFCFNQGISTGYFLENGQKSPQKNHSDGVLFSFGFKLRNSPNAQYHEITQTTNFTPLTH